jgi:hypothetical protein
MTCPLVPEFILDMFEREVTKINTVIVEKMCQMYDIDVKEAKERLSKELSINFNIVHEDIEQIKIVKKHQNKAKPNKVNDGEGSSKDMEEANDGEPTENTQGTQCEARVFVSSDLVVKQCSRSKMAESNLCKLHQRLKDEGKLKYGTINEEKPACISTAKLNTKVRRKIY